MTLFGGYFLDKINFFEYTQFIEIKTILLFIFFFNLTDSSYAKTFWWGVGNAAFQVEGQPQPSDWTEWAKIPGKIEDASDANTASDFWNRYDEDFALAEKLGAKMFRISIAWERIEPEENKYDFAALKHYQKIILNMRKHGLEPMVTLHHFVNPKWLAAKGGITWEGFPLAFEKFVKFTADALSPVPYSVSWWITLNEPMVLVLASYLNGEFPPGIKNGFKQAVLGSGHLALAHLQAIKVLKSINLKSQVSISQHWRPVYAKDEKSVLDKLSARFVHNFFHEQFLTSIMSGNVDMHLGFLFSFKKSFSTGLTSNLDFIGINYYARIITGIKFMPPFILVEEGPGEKQEMGWEIYPQGILQTIEQAHALTKLPVFITENGIADREDKWRATYLRQHIEQIELARAKGLPVLGYLHWTLTDNFEWAKGLNQNFGLCAIERPSLNRICRKSFEEFRQIIATKIKN